MWKKKMESLKEVKELDKKLLIKVSSDFPLFSFTGFFFLFTYSIRTTVFLILSGELRGSRSDRPGPGEHAAS